MILSVSRRTDIPAYYSEWFLKRLKEGYLYVRNPMNAHQISKIRLTPEVVDCMVFWTKNPKPLLSRLDELDGWNYYFQFTLTGFGSDMEIYVPHKKDEMIPIFQELSRKIGKEKVVWRYDPIIFTDKYTPEYHLKAFRQIGEALHGYTTECVISFLDLYAKNKKNMKACHQFFLSEEELMKFSREIAAIASENDMKIAACAEAIDLSSCGIKHSCCIDKERIEQITGYRMQVGKDRNQRQECGCVESIDVGAYHTCKNGCLYCYANYSQEKVLKNCSLYDVNAPILCGSITEDDKITERKVKSWKEQLCRDEQLCFRFGKETDGREFYGNRCGAAAETIRYK